MAKVRSFIISCAAAVLLASCGSAPEAEPAPAADAPQSERALRRAAVAAVAAIGTADGKLAYARLPDSDTPECGQAFSSEAGVWNSCAFSSRSESVALAAAISEYAVSGGKPYVFSDDCRGGCRRLAGVFRSPGTLESFLAAPTAENAGPLFSASSVMPASSFSVLHFFSSGSTSFALMADGGTAPLPGKFTNVEPALLAVFSRAKGVVLIKSYPLSTEARAEWYAASAKEAGMSVPVWRALVSDLSGGAGSGALAATCLAFAAMEGSGCERARSASAPPDPAKVSREVWNALASREGSAVSRLFLSAAQDAQRPW